MANPEHLNVLRQGVGVWNRWRQEHPHITPDLKEVDLHGKDLFGVDLHKADLSAANLYRADLRSANLTEAILLEATLQRNGVRTQLLQEAILIKADLTRAILHKADLSLADLSLADLRKADLKDAKLHGANLTGANLREANLTSAKCSFADFRYAILDEATLFDTNFAGALLGWTALGNVDLSRCRGLHAVLHGGPSIVGIDTFYRSRGIEPEAFFRAAGVPDAFFTYAAVLVNQPIQFYSCFISYSTKDQEFADHIHADLQDKGVRCWFAPHNIRGGRKLHEQIDEAIHVYDRLLLILSEHSMASEWVKVEIAQARKKELNERRQVLFPISLVPFAQLREWNCPDADTAKDSAREIREYFIPDFSNWQDHDSYDMVFRRLVSDLKAEPERSAVNRDHGSAKR